MHTEVVGNVYAIFASNIDPASIGSICGSFDSQLKNAVKNDGNKVKYLNNNCNTDNARRTMKSVVELDKQSPTRQANLVRAGLVSGFGSAGVVFSGCDVSSIPA
jgi:predicted secreted protein